MVISIKDYTKNGLLILMISVIFSILSTIILFTLWASIDFETITYDNLINILITIIPALVIAGVGVLLTLIGAIFIYLGRNEFGEKHKKFIKYALILILISILFSFMSNIITSALQYSSQTSNIFGVQDTSAMIDNLRNSTILSSIITVIGSVIGGLIWVFGLYNLEDENGKKILIIAYISMIVVAIAVAISTMMFFEEIINSALYQDITSSGTISSASSSDVSSSLQYLGGTLMVSVSGAIISNLLIFIALYIPYKRITSGELVQVLPALPTHLKRCMGCGRVGPSDSFVCAYCGKRFE